MKLLRYTLISDGPTDANLIPIINWTLREAANVSLAEGTHAEFWRLETPPPTLSAKIAKALELFPCEVLFIHRDAEAEDPRVRSAQIGQAVQAVLTAGCSIPVVAVVPVRMLEAWLLFSEDSIRKAAGNPNGKVPLNLPNLRRLEERPDPKRDLHDALRVASELHGRRLKKFRPKQAFWRVVEFLDDFSPLRRLSAFLAFEKSIRQIADANWTPGYYGR